MIDVFKTVQDVIVEQLGVDDTQVTMDANLQTDLGADSLDTVELIVGLEKAFGIQIPEEEADGIATVGDVVNYVQNLLGDKQ